MARTLVACGLLAMLAAGVSPLPVAAQIRPIPINPGVGGPGGIAPIRTDQLTNPIRLEVKPIGLEPAFRHIPTPHLDPLANGGQQQQPAPQPYVERVAERPVIVKDPPPPPDEPPPDGGDSDDEEDEKRGSGESNSFWQWLIAGAVLFVAYLGLTRGDN